MGSEVTLGAFLRLVYCQGSDYLRYSRAGGVTPVKDLSQVKSQLQAEIYLLSAKLHAIEVFGSQEAAEVWLAESNPALNGDIPSQILTSSVGLERVIDVLNAIRYGVFI